MHISDLSACQFIPIVPSIFLLGTSFAMDKQATSVLSHMYVYTYMQLIMYRTVQSIHQYNHFCLIVYHPIDACSCLFSQVCPRSSAERRCAFLFLTPMPCQRGEGRLVQIPFQPTNLSNMYQIHPDPRTIFTAQRIKNYIQLEIYKIL